MAAELGPAQITGTDGQVLTKDSTQPAGMKWAAGGAGSVTDASSTVKGVSKLSVDPVSTTNPIAAGDNDPRLAVAAAGTASIRKLGTGATDAAAGNDARLSDQRVPVDGSVTLAKLSFDPATQTELDAEATARANADALLAPLASPALTGNPTAPTQGAGNNTTRLANTAFVQQEIGGTTLFIPKSLGTTKGDTIVFTGSGTPVRKAAGADGKSLRADSGASDGLAYVADAVGPKSGTYFSTASVTAGNYNGGVGFVVVFPIWIPTRVTIDRIGTQIQVAVASAVFRMGMYADDGAGRPGSLVFDAGTVDGSTTGFKEIIISQTLSPGIYWIAGVQQVGACQTAGHAVVVAIPGVGTGHATNPNGGLADNGGNTGALPTPFVAAFQQASNGIPRIILRAA